MFVAKFSHTTGEPFKADKNGNYPMIGTVVAGKAKGSIINGTIARREGIEANKLYACDNSVNPEYPDNVQTDVLSQVTVLEFVELRKELGAPVSVGAEVEAPAAIGNEA